MERVVQVVLLAVLVAGFVAAVILFIKANAEKGGKSRLLKFLLIQVILFALAAAGLRLFAGPMRSVGVFLILSVFLAMLANAPLALVAGLISLFRGKK